MSTGTRIGRESMCLAVGLALGLGLIVGCSAEDEPTDDDFDADSSSDAEIEDDSAADATDEQLDTLEVLDTSSADDGDMREPMFPGCVIVEDLTVVSFDFLARYEQLGFGGLMGVMTSAEEFRALVGAEPPLEIDFETEWAALLNQYPGRAPMYGSVLELQHVEFCPMQMFWESTVSTGGAGCELLALEAAASVLVKFPAIEAAVEHELGDNDTVVTTFTCDASSPAEGAACTHGTLCQPGLLCAGLTRAESGVCVPAAQQLSVTNETSVPIADDGSTLTIGTNTVGALPGVDADVIVEAHFAHARPEELTVTLVHPSGERVVLWDHEPNEGAAWGLSGVPSLYRSAVGLTGAPVAGTWQLEILDDVPGNAGELGAWTLTVVTR